MSGSLATKGGLSGRFQRAATYAWRRRSALLAALPMLGLVSYRLRRYGYRATVEWLDQRTPPPGVQQERIGRCIGGGVADELVTDTANELAYVVRAAARVIPDATCLRKALVLRYLLGRQGIGSTVRLGVRPSDEEGLDFHAWLVVGDEVVSERQRLVADYVVLDDGQAPPGMSS